ncbi:MAG: spoIIIE [Planctomycetaceae bacterium]|nr:spoIIIE [Planctomycetaceae bacterium]
MWDLRRLRTDLFALLLLVMVVFSGLSLISYDPADPPAQAVFPARTEVLNWCGPAGAYVAHFLRHWFGLGTYVLLAGTLTFDVRLFSRKPIGDPLLRIFGGLLAVSAACAALHGLMPGLGGGPIVGSGGYIGAWGWSLLEEHFRFGGICCVLVAAFLAGTLISTDLWLFKLVAYVTVIPALVLRLRRGRDAVKGLWPDESTTYQSADEPDLDDSDAEPDLPILAPPPKKAAANTPTAPRMPVRVNPPMSMGAFRKIPTELPENYAPCEHPLPNPNILEVAQEFPYELLAKKAQIAAETLEKTFKEFGLNIRVVEIDTGPVITQFELELEAGLRLSKVSALADDLAIALRVPSVRVVAPIPGKNTVGVEVPNDTQVMVRLRELIETCGADANNKRIPIFLGKDVSGRPLTVDLAKMPHLLIAGRTGTGKSVCLNTLILSMLMTRTPEQVKMLMIDPKMVELSPYTRIPHLMHPVITDMKKAEAVLGWAVDKMEERYD